MHGIVCHWVKAKYTTQVAATDVSYSLFRGTVTQPHAAVPSVYCVSYVAQPGLPSVNCSIFISNLAHCWHLQ